MILTRKRQSDFTTKTTAATGDTSQAWLRALTRPLRAIFEFIIAKRTEQAELFIESRLPMMSDAELAYLGISRDQIDSFIEERQKARRAQRNRTEVH